MAYNKKALDALNKLNNYSGLPVDHRWVSTVRHYIKDGSRTVRPKRAVQHAQPAKCAAWLPNHALCAFQGLYCNESPCINRRIQQEGAQ